MMPRIGRRQEERDGVVAVPPLHERILHAGIDRVALQHRDRQREAVEDVEHRDRDDRRDVEPDGDVEVLLVPLREHPEEVDREDHPVTVMAMSIGHSSSAYSFACVMPSGSVMAAATMMRLPAPEVDLERKSRPSGLHETLRGVVDAGEHHVADEREDDGVRVERAKCARRSGGVEVHLPPRQLRATIAPTSIPTMPQITDAETN